MTEGIPPREKKSDGNRGEPRTTELFGVLGILRRTRDSPLLFLWNFRGICEDFRGVPNFPRNSGNSRGVAVTELTPRWLRNSSAEFRWILSAEESSCPTLVNIRNIESNQVILKHPLFHKSKQQGGKHHGLYLYLTYLYLDLSIFVYFYLSISIFVPMSNISGLVPNCDSDKYPMTMTCTCMYRPKGSQFAGLRF